MQTSWQQYKKGSKTDVESGWKHTLICRNYSKSKQGKTPLYICINFGIFMLLEHSLCILHKAQKITCYGKQTKLCALQEIIVHTKRMYLYIINGSDEIR